LRLPPKTGPAPPCDLETADAAPPRDRTGRSLDASISVVALRELNIERAGELVVQAADAVTAA
jgi:hypothetical protein